MALHNPSTLYSGGNVQFDATPTINLYANLMAKKQAKDEAIDEYYRKLPGTLNNAGMRDQDIEGFNNEVLSLQQEYNKNKAQIRKGTTPEALNYDQHLRRITEAINNSKNAAKTDLTLGTMRIKGENEHIFEDPNFMVAHQQHTLPVWDKNHKALDLGTIAVPPKPLDADAQNKIWNTVTNGIKPTGKEYDESKQTTNPVTMLTAVPYVKKFKQQQIEGIAENMGNLAKSDKSVYAHFNKILNNADEQTLNTLAKAYSSVYPDVKVNQGGKTFNVSQFWTDPTPDKVAQASAILRANTPQEEGEDYRPAKEAIMNKAAGIAKEKAAQQDVYTMKHIATSWGYRMQEGKNLQETVDNNYEADKEYAARNDGAVPTTPAKLKTLTGTTTGTLSMKDGDYIWKHGDKTEIIPGNQAKIKMMIVQKPAFVPGVTTANKDKQTTSGYSNITAGTDSRGNKITIGYKNGKWYNTQTGKEFK